MCDDNEKLELGEPDDISAWQSRRARVKQLERDKEWLLKWCEERHMEDRDDLIKMMGEFESDG